MSEFRITGHKGFHIEFKNGLVVSVQFGGGNYCENYDMVKIGSEKDQEIKSADAEVAIFDKGKKGNWRTQEFIKKATNKEVVGYITPDELVGVLLEVSKAKRTKELRNEVSEHTC